MALARILLPIACILPLAACGVKRERIPEMEVPPAQAEWFSYQDAPPTRSFRSPVQVAPKQRVEGEWGRYGSSPRPRTGHWKGNTAWRHPPRVKGPLS